MEGEAKKEIVPVYVSALLADRLRKCASAAGMSMDAYASDCARVYLDNENDWKERKPSAGEKPFGLGPASVQVSMDRRDANLARHLASLKEVSMEKLIVEMFLWDYQLNGYGDVPL
jgi:hypothetical protein